MSGDAGIFGSSDSFGLLPPPLARVFLGGPALAAECSEPAESTVCEVCQ